MRLALVLVVAVAGCYSPKVPANVPCDPAAPHCPVGQTCMGIAGAAVCSGSVLDVLDAPLEIDSAPIDAPEHDATIEHDAMIMHDASIMPDASIVPDAMLAPLHLDYPASIAVCLDPAMPDLTSCTAAKGTSQLAADNMNDAGGTYSGYLRFDLDGQLAGRSVMIVTLTLTDSGATDADSDDSGEIWRVGAFTQSSLALVAPMKAGTAPISPSQGAVALGQAVTFALPVGLVGANQTVYLGLFSVSPTGDGVQYWDKTGTTPPRLHIDAQ